MEVETEERLADELDLIVQGIHPDPHRVLGPHGNVIRLWRPNQEEVHVEVEGKIFHATAVRPGIFELQMHKNYRVHLPDGTLHRDPYSFSPTFSDEDTYLFSRGMHSQIYEVMGGRITTHEGVLGAKFALWAPNAVSVSLIGEFNQFDAAILPMRRLKDSGVWEIFIPGLTADTTYQFAIKTENGHFRQKSDPYALHFEKRPDHYSKLFSVDSFAWEDAAWMEKRALRGPMNIYEVHLGSWKAGEKEFYNYRELAPLLADYCEEMGYTHVEILPILEHPLDESWGYQVTGFYAVSSRYGTPEDFQFLVNYLHQNEIGVILDWVPAHFPIDDFSLARFDGTYLYEHEDPRKGFHPHWNTLIFNYGIYEVCNFLLGSALYFFEKMHIDGLRVDAVASMLYLDYGRKDGEWIPNKYGGNENLEAIEFLKKLNAMVHQKYPGAVTIAEESTAFPGITDSIEWGGLGFDLKWNMGWMNDTLEFFEKDYNYRKFHYENFCNVFSYAFSEKYVLVLSHDEVVHEKKSLISKMPGNEWEKFANLRLLLGFMACHPGKNLLFMGGELGQIDEWHCKEEIHWHLLENRGHQMLHEYVKKLNHFYLSCRPLWELDFDSKGFRPIDFSEDGHSFFRRGEKSEIVCVFNFTRVCRENAVVEIPQVVELREVFNSDWKEFGGSGKENGVIPLQKDGFSLQLAPLAMHIFEVEFE